MLGQVIFGAVEDLRHFEAQGVFPHIIRLQRQVSFFGDREGLNGLMACVGDEEVNCQVLGLLWDDRVRIITRIDRFRHGQMSLMTYSET